MTSSSWRTKTTHMSNLEKNIFFRHTTHCTPPGNVPLVPDKNRGVQGTPEMWTRSETSVYSVPALCGTSHIWGVHLSQSVCFDNTMCRKYVLFADFFMERRSNPNQAKWVAFSHCFLSNARRSSAASTALCREAKSHGFDPSRLRSIKSAFPSSTRILMASTLFCWAAK